MSHTVRPKVGTPARSSIWRLAIAAFFTVSCAGSVGAQEPDDAPAPVEAESTTAPAEPDEVIVVSDVEPVADVPVTLDSSSQPETPPPAIVAQQVVPEVADEEPATLEVSTTAVDAGVATEFEEPLVSTDPESATTVAPEAGAPSEVALNVVPATAADLSAEQTDLVESIEVQAADAPVEVLVITPATADQAAALLVGAGITFGEVTFVGPAGSLGSFSGGTDAVGFASGIVLSSGNVSDLGTPGGHASTDTAGAGDSRLDELSGFPTSDAAVLSFDFVPVGDTVTFEYVFGSEEYLEYVNSGYNDVFAFYVNGENCATVNGENITINNVNHLENTGSFVNNPDQTGTGLDGMTVVMTCTATVVPGQTNTLSLAIADASDPVLDSAVFIRGKSFSVPGITPTPEVPVTPTPDAHVTPSPEPTETPEPTTPSEPEPTKKSTPAAISPAIPSKQESTSAPVSLNTSISALPVTGNGQSDVADIELAMSLAGAGILLAGTGALLRRRT